MLELVVRLPLDEKVIAFAFLVVILIGDMAGLKALGPRRPGCAAALADGAKTGMLCHLGTISQQTGRKLHTDPKTGHIIGDEDAMKGWSRSYAPGWTPTA